MDRRHDLSRSRNEKIRRAWKVLTEGLTNYVRSGEWKTILRYMRLFHRYSFNNVLLILSQKPDATLVAGYHTWKRMGRYVKKGEKGILIIAPVFKKVKKTRIIEEYDPEINDYVQKEVVEEYNVLVGFKPVYVFDISQTEGKPLPELKFERLNIEDPELLSKLTEVANKIVSGGVIFREITERPVYGYYDPRTDEIHIDIRYSTLDQAATLIHEMGHAVIVKMGVELDRVEHELVAESVDFILMDYVGYDTSVFTFKYLARYIQTEENIKRLLELGEIIRDVSDRILDVIEEVEKSYAEASP